MARTMLKLATASSAETAQPVELGLLELLEMNLVKHATSGLVEAIAEMSRQPVVPALFEPLEMTRAAAEYLSVTSKPR